MRVFDWIKSEIEEFGMEGGNLKTVMSDYEPALMLAIEDKLPGAKREGCWFHALQAFRRKLGAYGLLKKLRDDSKFRHSFRCLCALAFAHHSDVYDLFYEIILNEDEFHPDLFEYALDYFLPTWIEGRNAYPIKTWNIQKR